ncbi:MAG: 30S ribosome-binding factor RbfA [Bryobacteraceae bacterium]
MDERRSRRVSEAVREELTEMIGFEMSDPRLTSVDVTDVDVSPDGKHAHVRVAVKGDDREQEKAMEALEHARHYLRHELAIRLSLRRVPELHFQSEMWVESGSRVEQLLRRVKKTRGPAENQP